MKGSLMSCLAYFWLRGRNIGKIICSDLPISSGSTTTKDLTLSVEILLY